ncbi:MAG: hypothetical protein ABSC62_12475 [Terracidiphilus sp.]|jgi:hypothetical protein
MQIGDTFYWNEGGHLWVVISDPNMHAGEFIAVNLTKDLFRSGKDCELLPSDHRWIKEKTYVSFGDALKINSKECLRLEKSITAGTINRHFPMRPATLQKIIAAAKKSKAFAPAYLAYL